MKGWCVNPSLQGLVETSPPRQTGITGHVQRRNQGLPVALPERRAAHEPPLQPRRVTDTAEPMNEEIGGANPSHVGARRDEPASWSPNTATGDAGGSRAALTTEKVLR